MTIKRNFLLVTAAAITAYGVYAYQTYHQPASYAVDDPLNIATDIAEDGSEDAAAVALSQVMQNARRRSLAGAYLSSQFAQRHQQWTDASFFLNDLKHEKSDVSAILKKSLVLEMGANNPEKAIETAHELLNDPNQDEGSLTLAGLFAVTGAFKEADYDQVRTLLKDIPKSGLALFMSPLIKGWLDTASGEYQPQLLRSHFLLMLHSVYMADYLGREDEAVTQLNLLAGYTDLPLGDLERIADIYMHLKQTDKAMKIYQYLLTLQPFSDRLNQKISNYDSSLSTYHPIHNPAEGLARAYYDMAHILFQDQSDDSARIFTNMALYLNPNLHEAHILLAASATRLEHYDQAITHYYAIPEGTPYFLQSRREIAGLYEDSGQPERGIHVLERLYKEFGDVNALVDSGDIKRRMNDYEGALHFYNQAQDHLGGTIPASKWPLLYSRGIAHEQLGQWELAAEALEKALAFQPNHPYILNYYGYALADRGLELDRALGMLQQALYLRPDDGYITDSVGWAFYKLKRYEDALPYLEKAVEILPSDPTVNDHLGDAYWQNGRKLEARYQWKRAALYGADDAALVDRVQDKIANGLNDVTLIKSAQQNGKTRREKTQ